MVGFNHHFPYRWLSSNKHSLSCGAKPLSGTAWTRKDTRASSLPIPTGGHHEHCVGRYALMVTKNQHLDANIQNFDFGYRGFTTSMGFRYPILVYEGMNERPEPFLMACQCNLNPNNVGGQGQPLLYKSSSKNQSSDPNVGF